MRISRQQMFMLMSRAAAMRSTCFRLNVGAIVVVGNRPVSVGYNGAPSGEPHCAGNACPGRHHCRQTIHAETNALKHVPEDLKDTDWDLYVTHSPCSECADLIVGGRPGLIRPPVKRVFFEVPYRKTEHLDNLAKNVELYQVTPAGYVVEWVTGEVVTL